MATIDIAIVVLYVVGTTFLGAWFTRRQRDVGTYFVGDRNVSWWLVLISIVATETSTVTFLSVPGLAFKGNLAFLQLSFGFILGRMIIAWLLLPQFLSGQLFSAYQLLRQRFDVRVQRTASAIFLATRVVADGLRLFLASQLLEEFLGWNSVASILAIGVVTMIYTYLGGMQAVIWTDLIQFVIYIAGALLAAGCIVQQIDGGWHGIVAAGASAHKFRLLVFEGDFGTPYTFAAGLVGGAFITMASHGADQMMVQRYLCSRSLGQARAALVASGFVVLVQFLLFLSIGVGLYVLVQQGSMADMPGDKAFGSFIVHFLPHGIVGLLIAAVLAASMSSLSSSLNSSSSAFVSDFYRPLRPGRSDGHYLLVSRLMTSVWGLTRIAVAMAGVSLVANSNVVTEVLRVAAITTGTILGLFLLGSMRRPVCSGAALTGLVAGFVVVVFVWAETPIAWPWYAPVGSMVTVAVALLVNPPRSANGAPADRSTQPGLDQSR